MALIAHYRLDGNADDAFGKFNGVASNVTWAAGKLGQAASFNGSTSYIDCQVPDATARVTTSYCCWVSISKLDAGTPITQQAGAIHGRGFAVKPDGRVAGWSRNSAGTWQETVSLQPLTVGRFHHLAFVQDTNTISLYVDGVLQGRLQMAGFISTYNSFLRVGNYTNANFPFSGLIDDVRIYDHALSVREVRDLAMGLAAHYPMLDFQEPTENLLSVRLDTAPDLYGKSTKTYLGNGEYRFVNNGTGDSNIRLRCPLDRLVNGATYASQVKFKNNTGYVGIDWCDVGLAGSPSSSAAEGVLYGTAAKATYDATYNFLDITIGSGTSVTLYEAQVEHKPHVTSYTDSIRSARIVDTSGQGADAPLALATAPKWIEESPTGRGAYDFSAPNHCVAIPDTKENYHDGFTLACWAYKRGAGGASVGRLLDKSTTTSASGGFFLYNNGSQLAFGIANGSAPLTCAIPTAQWFHVVVTVDTAGNARIYRDGELTHQAAVPAPSQILTSNPLTIGNRSTASDRHWDGLVSDFRFYSAPITADQVKELYQQRASLDAQGNFYAQLINERGVTKFQVTKAGQLSSQVSEVGITNGLIAYYPLNKDAQDYSGNGLHGVANGATAVGGGFDGKGAHLFASGNNIVANNVTLGSATSFCMWACMDNATVQMLFSTDRPGGGGCDLFFAGSTISWNTGDSQNNAFKNNGANVTYPSTGVWHHFAVVNDPVSSEARLYIDGVLYGTAAHRDTTQANRRFIVGNYNASTSYAWAGKIANCKVFNRALTAQEIAVEYKRTGPTKMTQHQGVTYIQGEFKEV